MCWFDTLMYYKPGIAMELANTSYHLFCVVRNFKYTILAVFKYIIQFSMYSIIHLQTVSILLLFQPGFLFFFFLISFFMFWPHHMVCGT